MSKSSSAVVSITCNKISRDINKSCQHLQVSWKTIQKTLHLETQTDYFVELLRNYCLRWYKEKIFQNAFPRGKLVLWQNIYEYIWWKNIQPEYLTGKQKIILDGKPLNYTHLTEILSEKNSP